jgi:putative ABC transport system ATP-binding protein
MTPGDVQTPNELARLDHLWVEYGGRVPVSILRDVHMSLKKGESVAVIGKSGSGKSTLLNVIGMLERPTRGSYWIEGCDVSLLDDAERAFLRSTYFGFVFQRFHLLGDRTALENVELGMMYGSYPRSQRRNRALDALEQVGMTQRAHAFPEVLSGGESQRVAIARALAQKPQVLICDEPTGNLDGENTQRILTLLLEINACGVALIVATHDFDVASALSVQLGVSDGALIRGAMGI